MGKIFFALCGILSCAPLFSQDVPANYRLLYYYKTSGQPADQPGIKPDKKMMKILASNNCVFIDSSTFKTEAQHGYDSIWNTNKSLFVSPFFVHGTEITNAEYKEFLSSHSSSAYYPDTMVWKGENEDDNPYVHYYFQHYAYSNYPVVGINHWQAVQYCAWKTEQLNSLLSKKGIKGYRLVVDLPTETEFDAVVSSLIPKWLQKQKRSYFESSEAGYTSNYVLGSDHYRANFGKMISPRLQSMKLPLYPGDMSEALISPSVSYPGVFGVYNILGNVSEWTSTSANGTLYNTTQFMYTFSDKLIPNQAAPVDSAVLKKRLNDPKIMETHFAVKGGSWKEEFFYLQPAAVQFRSQMYRSSFVGFRYVVRVLQE